VALPPDFTLDSLFPDGKSLLLDGTEPNPVLPAFWPYTQQLNLIHLMLIPISLHSEIIGSIVVARKQPSHYFLPDNLRLAETIANQVAGALENRRLLTQERRQREVAERRSHELVTLLDISHEVSAMHELEPLLNLLVHYLEQVIDFSTFLLLELGGEELFILVQRGVVPNGLSPEDEFPSEWLQAETPLFTARSPLIVADLAQDRQLSVVLRKTFSHKAASLLQETHSCLLVPIITRAHIVGLLWFGHHQPDLYTEVQAEYITAIASQVGIAIENAHYYEEMQAAAADRERNHLAQELHDSVSQTLLSANLIAESLPTLWEQAPEQGRHALRQLHFMMRSALAEMRSLMLELRPAMLGQKPLGEILRQLSNGFAGRSQIAVQLKVSGDTILPAICQIAFYRVAQGALNNILQHAHASQVIIELNCLPKYVELRIADDGVGFDPAAVASDRMGLTIMRERAEKIGATFQVESKPGQGTQITVRYDYPIG
jgi:two-component system nitrate/nitrite sensor histidine kinase NarX